MAEEHAEKKPQGLGGVFQVVSGVTKELTNPWDISAAFFGASLGLAGSLVLHGVDGFTLAGIGATALVGARRGLFGLSSRGDLQKRAEGFKSVLMGQINHATPQVAEKLVAIERQFEIACGLWNPDKTAPSDERFAKKLDELERLLSEAVASAPLALPAPAQPIVVSSAIAAGAAASAAPALAQDGTGADAPSWSGRQQYALAPQPIQLGTPDDVQR